MSVSQYMTLGEIAQLLEIEPLAVERLVALGKFPAPLRIGGRYCRWVRADVDAYLEHLDRFIPEEG